eukprot:s2712_g10.t1
MGSIPGLPCPPAPAREASQKGRMFSARVLAWRKRLTCRRMPGRVACPTRSTPGLPGLLMGSRKTWAKIECITPVKIPGVEKAQKPLKTVKMPDAAVAKVEAPACLGKAAKKRLRDTEFGNEHTKRSQGRRPNEGPSGSSRCLPAAPDLAGGSRQQKNVDDSAKRSSKAGCGALGICLELIDGYDFVNTQVFCDIMDGFVVMTRRYLTCFLHHRAEGVRPKLRQ